MLNSSSVEGRGDSLDAAMSFFGVLGVDIVWFVSWFVSRLLVTVLVIVVAVIFKGTEGCNGNRVDSREDIRFNSVRVRL